MASLNVKKTATNKVVYDIRPAIGMKDFEGNNVGILNLTAVCKDQNEASKIAQNFIDTLVAVPEEVLEKCLFIQQDNGHYRLAAANNRTIGFYNGKTDFNGASLNDVELSVYSSEAKSKDDFKNMFGM